MRIQYCLRAGLVSALCFVTPLTSEIQTVTVKWTPSLCRLASCIKGLEQQFGRVKGVDNVQINQEAGQAVLVWKKNVEFSYKAVNMALQMIGLYSRDIRLRVRGHITHDDKTITLISEGDGTRFVLYGPIQAKPLQQNVQFNVLAHPISDELKTRLLATQDAKQIVMIEGPLLLPERSPPDPYKLIVEHLDIAPAASQS